MYLLSERAARIWCVFVLSAALCVSAVGDDKADHATVAEKAKDKVYQPGGDVKSPVLKHYVEPDFSSSSKDAYREGVVRITTVVKADGTPSDLHIVAGLNQEEDQKAVDAVGQWRFQPGTRAGQPVNVRVTVEVDFHLL